MNGKLETIEAAKVYYKGVNDLRLIGCLTTDGALGLETIEVKPIFDGDQIPDLEVERRYPAKEIVREFIDRHQRCNVLVSRGRPTVWYAHLNNWDRIVTLAQESGSNLPACPDSVALDAFLIKARVAAASLPRPFPGSA